MDVKESRSGTDALNLVDGDLVDRVRRLELFSRFRVEGVLTGVNKSPFKGYTADFLQHRQYFRGDSLKYLDWRIYGKREKLVIREYEELTNAPVTVILDISNSMSFRGASRSLSKLDFSIRCAALIFYMAFLHKDSFSLNCFNTNIALRIPLGGGKKQVHRMLRSLVELSAGGRTDFTMGLQEATAPIKRKGLTVVFSDFMDDPDIIIRTVSRLRFKGSDVIVMQVFDPEERALEFGSITRFYDLETPEIITIDPQLMRREYIREFDQHQMEMKAACLSHGFDHTLLSVEDEFEVPLLDYIRHRVEIYS